MADRPTNRHPADALHDIRAQLKALEAEEATLRAYLLEHPHDRVGAEHVAVIKSQSRKWVDLKALAAEVGAAVVSRFTSRRSLQAVWLEDRTAE